MSLPILGAALSLEHLDLHRDWLLDKQRDVELQDFFAAEVLSGDWRPQAERIRTVLDGHTGRVGIHGPFVGFTLDTGDPEVRAVVKKRLDQGLDACEAVGADQMVIHSPFTTWDHNNLDDSPQARASKVERVHLAVGDAVRRAERQGCVLVFENIEDVDPHARVRLAESFGSPAVRVSLDTGHANYAHGSTGAPPVDYYVHAAGNMLAHVHVQDSDGYADRHWLPGEGNVPWRTVFRALARLESDPRLILELRDPGRLRDGAAWLQAQGVAQ